MSKEVARSIFYQLGGNRFASMVGAKNFVSHSEQCGGVSFRIPATISKNRINYVKNYLEWFRPL